MQEKHVRELYTQEHNREEGLIKRVTREWIIRTSPWGCECINLLLEWNQVLL